MASNIDRIKRELMSLEYRPRIINSPYGEVVTFSYTVETGSHKGETFTVGVNMDGSGRYPEYPPHWIHISPPIDDGRGGAVERFRDSNRREWTRLSRPPGELWDHLPTKHMTYYINEHLRRFWNDI